VNELESFARRMADVVAAIKEAKAEASPALRQLGEPAR